MQSLKFQARPHPCVGFGQRTPTRWELFRYSPIQYIARQAYEAYATLSPQATIRPGFHHPKDTIIRVVCISDTHSRHRCLPHLPPGDILIHAGDLTRSGTEPKIRKSPQLAQLRAAPAQGIRRRQPRRCARDSQEARCYPCGLSGPHLPRRLRGGTTGARSPHYAVWYSAHAG